MRRRVVKLDDGLLAYVGNNDYTISIVMQGASEFLIRSQERIVSCDALPNMRKTYMQKNRVVSHCYLLIVDRRLTWTLYRVKNIKEEPEQLYVGTLMSESHELASIVGVVEIAGKVVIVFSQWRLLFLSFPEEDRPNLPIFSREFIPYGSEPQYQHAKFAVRSYLPNEQEHQPLLCTYRQVSTQGGVLFMAYKSRANQLCSVYVLEYNSTKGYFLSGKNVLHNIQQVVYGVYSTALPNVFVIHTADCIVLWKISLQRQNESSFVRYQMAFQSNISPVMKDGQLQAFTGVALNNKVILFSINKKSIKLEQEQLKINAYDILLIEVLADLKKEEYYCLTAQEELYLISKQEKIKIISNEHTIISSSSLRLNPNYNFIIVDKIRGQQKGKLIFGNHLFAFDAEHYQHGLHFSNSTIINAQVNNKQIGVYITSPLIGVQKISIGLTIPKQTSKQPKLKMENSFQISLQVAAKLMRDQTLYLGNKMQITSDEVSQIGKKGIKVSKLFEDATDYITRATVLSNEIIVLAISDQIHIFDSKFTRKYIYCCNGQIKNIFALNDVNLLGVQLFDYNPKNGNELLVLILEEEKARKMKNIPIPQEFNFIQLSTVINTSEYKLNIFGRRLVICSNDSLHRFQLQKIIVQDFSLPLPDSSLSECIILPIYSLSNDKTNDFLVVFREEKVDPQAQFDEVEVYFASFNNKYLFKKFDLANITLSCQRILTLTQLPRDQPLFTVLHQYEQGGQTKTPSIFRTLLIIGERYSSICSMKLGRIQIEWLENNTYLTRQLSKIQSLPRDILDACNLLPITKPINILPTNKKEYFLLSNAREIYYTFCSGGNAQQISYYSLINDDFSQFRNSISVGQLQDEQFMRVFNKKMVIRGLRYLSDRAILVLYQSSIVILQVGFNNALNVRQQLKFKAHPQGDVMQIQQFLQNYDQHSLYLRDAHGRIYVLKLVDGVYEIVLHANIDDDVLLFSRVAGWNQRERVYALQGKEQENGYQEELVLKKDGQLSVKNLAQNKQDNNKFTYL